MKCKSKLVFIILLLTMTTSILPLAIQRTEARTEQIFDSNNKDLKVSLEAPNSWNSGIISQTIAKLNWRLNGLTATNDDLSAFFAVVNLPSLAKMALPVGEKTGLLSLIIGHYVTVNGESDVSLSDGTKAHKYSITVTTEQLHNLKAPIDKGFDAFLLTTNQQGGSYIIIYAAQQGRLGEFSGVLENILKSVRFGEVAFSSGGTTSTS
ncbi:MAG TPA: hypothetical protein VF884_13350 [Nitrososphaeraceae archaeon]